MVGWLKEAKQVQRSDSALIESIVRKSSSSHPLPRALMAKGASFPFLYHDGACLVLSLAQQLRTLCNESVRRGNVNKFIKLCNYRETFVGELFLPLGPISPRSAAAAVNSDGPSVPSSSSLGEPGTKEEHF